MQRNKGAVTSRMGTNKWSEDLQTGRSILDAFNAFTAINARQYNTRCQVFCFVRNEIRSDFVMMSKPPCWRTRMAEVSRSIRLGTSVRDESSATTGKGFSM